jgi:flagellar biosynthesis protein
MSEGPSRPPTRAAALRYRQGEDQAPALVAKGRGVVADRILEIAREHGIPIHQDPSLVDVLSRLDLEQQIPPALYVVVAEILAFIYRAQATAVDISALPPDNRTGGEG